METLKKCTKCGVEKPVSEFPTYTKPRRPHWCLVCFAEYWRRWRRANPDKRRQIDQRRSHKRGANNPHKQLTYYLKHEYGITPTFKEEMYSICRGRCAVCGGKFKNIQESRIDHDHSWNHIRGLVHDRCNILVGYRERLGPEVWARIDAYVREHEKNTIP